MNRPIGLLLGLALAATSVAAQKPLATPTAFNGKFAWLKLGTLPTATTKGFTNVKSIVVKIQLKKDARLKKDANGNTWFTVILSDQGSDWKWHQTSGSGAFPISGGRVKAGTYAIKIPVAGIPASVLKDKMQTVSVGPAASGLVSPVPIAVLGISGK